MGTVGLRKVRQNRVLLVTEDRHDAPNVVDQTINCAEGARATLGMDISDVVVLEKELFMQTGVSDSGRVTGRVERLGHLLDMLREKRGTYDAVALATRITPHIDTVELHRVVLRRRRPEPVGRRRGDPHAPDLDRARRAGGPRADDEQRSAADRELGRRRAAEGRRGHLHDLPVLRPEGPQPGPADLVNPTGVYDPSVITAEDVSALVIPDGCVGLPTLAAVEQGIPVIAVRSNTNLMRNDLRALPFRAGQLHYAANYYEAAGILSAMKAGVAPATIARPMQPMRIERVAAEVETNGKTNGHANGHANGNGNGKAAARRRPRPPVDRRTADESEVFVEVGGQ